MRILALVSACLVSGGIGRRVHVARNEQEAQSSRPLAALALNLLANSEAGFTLPATSLAHSRARSAVGTAMRFSDGSQSAGHFDPLLLNQEPSGQPSVENFAPGAAALGLAALAAFHPEAALAKGGEYGIFEGRIASLAHPVIMATMYAASAYAAFSGYQWRRTRELGTEISELKKKHKPRITELKDKIAAVEEGNPVPADLTQELASLEAEIQAMTDERKDLAAGDFRDKHWQAGSIILGLGTAFAIEGPVNTFIRANKLFPGPHLYAGAGVVVSWALAAAMVPNMQKGKDWARNAHIAINLLALGLFTWQLPTGWEITLKVIKFTKFP